MDIKIELLIRGGIYIKIIKKGIVLSLAVIMLFQLGGCSKDTKIKNGELDEIKQSSGIPSEVIKDIRDDIYPAFDMGGRTIKIASWYANREYDSNDHNIEDKPDKKNDEYAQMQLDNIRRIENKYNVKIECINMDRNAVKNNLYKSVAAGDPDMDIYAVDLMFAIPAIASGFALPISDYASGSMDIINEKLFMETLNSFGNEDLFRFNYGYDITVDLLAYNLDLLKSLELEDPKVLYERGEWNWEKFADYASLASKDIDGDGMFDQYGFYGNFTSNFSFVYTNNGIIANSPIEGLSSPNVMEAFQFINRLYNIDKTAKPESNNDTTLKDANPWAKGNILFWAGYPMSAEDKRNMGINFEMHYIPYPLGPRGDGTMYGTVGNIWYMIPKGTENPEQVYQVYEEYMNWFNFDTNLLDGKKLYSYLEEDDYKLAKEVGDKKVLDFATFISLDLYEYYNKIVSNTLSVEEATEIYKIKLQNKLDEIFKTVQINTN